MLLFLQSAQTLLPRLLGPAIVGVLLVASLPAVLDANATLFSTVQESVITVKEKQVYCTNDRVHPALTVKDQAGNVITQTAVGTQVLIEAVVGLDCNVYLSGELLTMIFEVRDEEGITNYLAWQIFAIESGDQIMTGLSWTPEKPGNYEVRFFPITCLRCTGIFHNIVTYEITVI